ncbi:hypothetical protein LTR15_009575 [Elasticomyces elasticus]|nr:hypothetical protein LTR15_009575 [Elasticomyces elasticus]
MNTATYTSRPFTASYIHFIDITELEINQRHTTTHNRFVFSIQLTRNVPSALHTRSDRPESNMMNEYNWALTCRKANGEKIVPIRKTFRSTGPTSQSENKDKCMPQKKVFAHKNLSPIPLQTQQDNSFSTAQYEQARSAEVVTKPFRIMDMPPELRLKTLSYLIEDKLTVFLRGFYNSPTGIALPGIAYASKAVRAEYLALALEATTFTIHSGAGNDRFQDWLGDLDLSIFSSNYSNGYSAIKSLSFPYFSRFHHQLYPPTTPNNDIELMVKCRNLEKVSINWAGDALLDQNFLAKDVQQLRSEYRLDRLLELRGAKRISLIRFRVFLDNAQAALESLAEWLRGAMPKDKSGNGPEVVIV